MIAIQSVACATPLRISKPVGVCGQELSTMIQKADALVPPVTRQVLELHQAPGLQLLQPHRDIGAGEAEPGDDFIRVEGAVGEEKQGIDLPHLPVDASTGAHFTEMENEGGGGGGQVHEHQYVQELLK